MPNTITSQWFKRILETAISEHHEAPKILNTDQGSQLTAHEFCEWAAGPKLGIRLRMYGKGTVLDNIFNERLWRSVKYELVHLFPPAKNGFECDR